MGTIGERDLAKLVGAALSTVQNRRNRGLLPSFKRDDTGRWRAPRDAALAEWRAVPRRQMLNATPVEPSVATDIAARVTEAISPDFGELFQWAARLVPAVVAGAAEELQATGRAPTAENLGAVFQVGDEDCGVRVFCGLLDMAGEQDDATAAARQIGRNEARRLCNGNR